MGNKKEKELRECEECGEPIESGHPTVRLCKRCASFYQTKRRPKAFDRKKRKKKNEDYFEEPYSDFEVDFRKKRKKKRGEEKYYEEYR
jgi:hypothetical protein